MKITVSPAGKKRWLREVLLSAVMLTGVFAFRSSVAEPYVVPTGSMEPTILPGDYLLVSKAEYGFKVPFTSVYVRGFQEPRRGDVIVFQYPVDTSISFVKRLIGLPGDLVEVLDGEIRVNGQPFLLEAQAQTKVHGPVQVQAQFQAQEDVVSFKRETIDGRGHEVQRLPHFARSEVQRFKIPEGQYFFMGDNRDNSNDSRSWGLVPRSYLKGRAVTIWLSLNRASALPQIRWQRWGLML